MGIGISKGIPDTSQVQVDCWDVQKSLAYMGFEEDDVIGKPIDFLFSLVVVTH
jgi:3-isopropylmalate/(R)-2-methylmalate dehydratase large subunit